MVGDGKRKGRDVGRSLSIVDWFYYFVSREEERMLIASPAIAKIVTPIPFLLTTIVHWSDSRELPADFPKILAHFHPPGRSGSVPILITLNDI